MPETADSRVAEAAERVGTAAVESTTVDPATAQ
jgi:hypothetical protein